jgi:Tol biopolymer transport system component
MKPRLAPAILATSLAAALVPSGSAQPLATTSGRGPNFVLESTISFFSNRDGSFEIYLMNPDGENLRRLTDHPPGFDGDAFGILSPDGKKLVFDSNRLRAAGEGIFTSDLFVMNTDGTEQTFLTRGSTATWSPDSKKVAFHASASGAGCPLRRLPGSPTTDSDLFVVNLDDRLAGVEQPRNVTNTVDKIDEDADWSPDGELLVYTAHNVGDDKPAICDGRPPPALPYVVNTAEIYVTAADGSGTPAQLTVNLEEERAPEFSPDGKRIVYMCRTGGGAQFDICVMDADGTHQRQLTFDPPADPRDDLGPHWSPDGLQIVFQRPLAGGVELFVMNADGSGVPIQITDSAVGTNLIADWGQIRVHSAMEET